MRKTRFMSLLFLVWSIAFFLLPDFRQALQVPFFIFGGGDNFVAGRIPAEKLREATQHKPDARTFAFAALHAPTTQEALQWADQAVATDPGFTWIYLSLINPALNEKQNPPDVHALVARLEKWDPDNAVPYLFDAEEIATRKKIAFYPEPAVLDAVAKETEWCQAMQKAFAAPRYDSYYSHRFDLERSWLRQNHLDKPAIVLVSVAGYPIPNLLNIRAYTNLLVDKYGKEEEDAKHLPQALSYYWTAEHMAERMHAQGSSLIEKLMGLAVQKVAGKRLIPALRQAGQTDAAATLEVTQQQFDQLRATLAGRDPLAQSANYTWSALTVDVLAGLVAVFGVLTGICLIYVNAKRWLRPGVRGQIFQLLTVAENYMPILLFMVCVALYLSYYPYALNFHHYMTASGEIQDFEPLFYNVLPYYSGPLGHTALPIGNPFRPYAWYALGGLVLVLLAAAALRRRTSGERPMT
jgi:hypothetical protein